MPDCVPRHTCHLPRAPVANVAIFRLSNRCDMHYIAVNTEQRQVQDPTPYMPYSGNLPVFQETTLAQNHRSRWTISVYSSLTSACVTSNSNNIRATDRYWNCVVSD